MSKTKIQEKMKSAFFPEKFRVKGGEPGRREEKQPNRRIVNYEL